LNRVLGVSQAGLGWLLWIPPLGWELGYLFWGYVVDRRASFLVLLRVLALASAPLALVPLLSGRAPVMAALFFAMFVAAGFVIVSLGYATRTFGTRQSAYLAGLGAGSWSALVMVVMPVFGHLFDRRAYPSAFALAAAFPLAAYLVWRLLARPHAINPRWRREAT
jgi:ACS family hexuronate transporter-like MFS transporter